MIFGFHAVIARLRQHPASIQEVLVDTTRRDKRMQEFLAALEQANIRTIPADAGRLDGSAKGARHQGVVAFVEEIALARTLDDLLDELEKQKIAPFLLVLDGVTDPHNLGACLRVADAAGAHAVVAPKDRAAGLNATVHKVASGAADTVPYYTVTNLARTLRELQERQIWVVGTAGEATQSLYQAKLTGPLALVLGAEGEGMLNA